MRGRTLVVDIRHWLDQDGSIPRRDPRFRRQVLRIARLIEYGGPLKPGELRETLVECRRRPMGKDCPGLMWVEKHEAEPSRIHAYCVACGGDEVFISGWEDTDWADGMMEPASAADLEPAKGLH